MFVILIRVSLLYNACYSKTLTLSYSKKYPLIVFVYGGPKSQIVNHYWSVSWKDYLVTNYDIVYAAIDGRGTGYQVTSFCFTRP